jgi:cytochrome o ubiquinol oxidase operon protein cyoD
MKHNLRSMFWAYTAGFILSLVLTVAAYGMVTMKLFPSDLLTSSILVLAMLQLFVQLFFFLHLGRDPKTRWNVVFFIATAGMIFIVVIGSMWIMSHLNYNMMPGEVEEHMMEDEAIYPNTPTMEEEH